MKKKTTTPQRGRPQMKPEDRKGKIVGFRVEADDQALIENAAKRANLRLSDWIRDRLVTAATAETNGK